MKNSKAYKYKNYGSIPQNEYRTNNAEKNAGSDAPFGCKAQAGDTAYKQRLIKRQALHSSSLKKSRGWAHTWKTNGWRAESASQDDEYRFLTNLELPWQKSSKPKGEQL